MDFSCAPGKKTWPSADEEMYLYSKVGGSNTIPARTPCPGQLWSPTIHHTGMMLLNYTCSSSPTALPCCPQGNSGSRERNNVINDSRWRHSLGGWCTALQGSALHCLLVHCIGGPLHCKALHCLPVQCTAS